MFTHRLGAKDLHRSCIEPLGIAGNRGQPWAAKWLKPLKKPVFMQVRRDLKGRCSTTELRPYRLYIVRIAESACYISVPTTPELSPNFWP